MRLDICAFTVALCLFSPAMGLLSIASLIFGQASLSTSSQDTSIQAGGIFSLVDNAFSFLGVNNQGGLYLTGSASDSTSVKLGGDSFINSGITSCDSSRSKGLSFFAIQPSLVFKNSGKMFLGLGDVASSALGFTITASSSWTNTGMIVLKSLTNPCGAKLGGTSITNEGSICLYKTVWAHSNSISGSGCIAVHAGAQFTTSASGTTIPSSHVILLGSASSTFNINGFASLSGSLIGSLTGSLFGGLLGGLTPSYTVAGFGNSNKIFVDFQPRSHTYDANSGILTLIGLSNKCALNIGKGYDSNSFQRDSSAKSICYTKAPPSNPPSRCACEPEFPAAPSSTVSSVSTSKTASSSATTVAPATSTIVPTSTSSSKVTSSSTSSAVPTSTSTTSSVAPSSTSSSSSVAPTLTSSSSSKVISTSTSSTSTVVPTTSTSSTAAPTTTGPGDDEWT